MKKRSCKIKVKCFDYFICSGKCRKELENCVVSMCNSGWVPVGGVVVGGSVGDIQLYQAVALYE